ncbi:uncharacterized protein [Oryctolagus cuniculus]|uniref:uncharacterized protein n=1 Tax=Oryctolagus cuniculus TaxID=9986 RepID=UPI00387A3B11
MLPGRPGGQVLLPGRSPAGTGVTSGEVSCTDSCYFREAWRTGVTSGEAWRTGVTSGEAWRTSVTSGEGSCTDRCYFRGGLEDRCNFRGGLLHGQLLLPGGTRCEDGVYFWGTLPEGAESWCESIRAGDKGSYLPGRSEAAGALRKAAPEERPGRSGARCLEEPRRHGARPLIPEFLEGRNAAPVLAAAGSPVYCESPSPIIFSGSPRRTFPLSALSPWECVTEGGSESPGLHLVLLHRSHSFWTWGAQGSSGALGLSVVSCIVILSFQHVALVPGASRCLGTTGHQGAGLV